MSLDPGQIPADQRRLMLAAARRTAALVIKTAPVQGAGYLAVTLTAAAIPVAAAWLTKLTLDRLVTPGPLTNLAGLAIALAAAGLVAAVTPQLGEYLRAELDRRASLQAKDELFAAMERLTGLGPFEDPAFLDRLRLAKLSATEPARLVDSIFQVGQNTIILAGFIGSLAVINPWFTALVLMTAVPALAIELRLSRQRAAVAWQLGPAERRELFYTELLGSIDAAKEIRLFALGSFLRGRMNNELRTINTARRRMDRRELSLQGGTAFLSALLAGAGLIWTIITAAQGHASIGDVSMFVAAVAGVQGAISGLVGATATGHHQLLMFGHYITITQTDPNLTPPTQPRDLPELRLGIELRDVWFRYSDEHPWVLRGVNLFIPHGKAVALVGHNGSGKSTLVKLLCRFYDPDQGTVLWDGVDLRDVPVPELRDRIGAVFQDFMCYDFSATDNIAVGDLPALHDQTRVSEAATHAGAHDIVASLPRGYDTLLTRMFFTATDAPDPQTGVVLSGGQWQRLALARAFLRKDRDLLILDEPSSGLDAEAEHDIHLRLRSIRSDRTSLLISHRLGTVRDADLIAVLANGVIHEHGTHTQLVNADGTYARLFALQAAGYTADQHPHEIRGVNG